MKVMALDVSKGKCYVVIYEEELCVAEWEIKHNQEGFDQLKSQMSIADSLSRLCGVQSHLLH